MATNIISLADLIGKLALAIFQGKRADKGIARDYQEMHAVASAIAYREAALHIWAKGSQDAMATLIAAEKGEQPPNTALLSTEWVEHFKQRQDCHMKRMLSLAEARRRQPRDSN